MNPEFLGSVAENSKRGKAVRRAQPKDVENLNDVANSGPVAENSKRRRDGRRKLPKDLENRFNGTNSENSKRGKAVRRALSKDVENLNDVANSVRSLHLDETAKAFGIEHGVLMEGEPPVKAKVRESGEREELYRLYMCMECPKVEDAALEFYVGVMSLVMGSREKALSVLRGNQYDCDSFVVGLTEKEAAHLFITQRGNKDIRDKILDIYNTDDEDVPFFVDVDD